MNRRASARGNAVATTPWGCRAPIAFVLVALVSAALCCTLGVAGGAVIGELTGGLLSRSDTPSRSARPTAGLLVDRVPLATPSPMRSAASRTPWPAAIPPALPEGPPPALADQSAPGIVPDPAQSPAAPAPTTPPVQAAPLAVALPANQPARPATRLTIPTLGVDAPVVVIGLQGGTWPVDQLTQEVGHMQGTASPGDPSNVAIAGHVTLVQGGDGPFRNLSQLKQGDEVWAWVGDQPYRYAVTQVRMVSPEDVHVTAPTIEPTLTLITCANWNRERRAYNDRIVAVARLTP